MNTRHFILLIALCGVFLTIGCKKEEIRVYEAPKSQPVAQKPANPHGNMDMSMMQAMAAKSEQIQWDLPDGWKQNPAKGMRYASFDIGVNPDVIDNSVIALGNQGQAAAPLPNVNRWLEQVGHEPVKSEEELAKYLQSFEVAGEEVIFVDVTGPEGDYGDPGKRVVAAIIPHGSKVWYFKMIGDTEEMEPFGDNFAMLIKSVRFEQPQRSQPPQMNMTMAGGNIEDTSKGVGPISYEVPQGWKDIQPPQPPRIAHLVFDNGHDQGQVVVTRFPGDVGGPLANVNRWRRQAGLGPIQKLEDHQPAIERMREDQAVLVDIAPPAGGQDDAHRPRIIVLYYQLEGYTWFFKMQGAYELLEQNKASFISYVQSISFGEQSSG